MNGQQRERSALLRSIRTAIETGYDAFYIMEKAESWSQAGKITQGDLDTIIGWLYPEQEEGQNNEQNSGDF